MDLVNANENASPSAKMDGALLCSPFSSSRIYWDGLGLSQSGSGVFVHAQSLAIELNGLGVNPVVVSPEPPVLTNVGFLRQKSGFFPKKLAQAKIFEPICTKKSILEYEKAHSRKMPPAILHGLSNINLPVGHSARHKLRTVLTVHDLIPLLEPGCTSRAYWAQFAFLLPRVGASADRIVCVSEWTRRTLLQRFPELGEKAVVIRNGRDHVNTQTSPKDLEAEERIRSNPIIMYVARFEGYKRINVFFDILRHGKGTYRGILVSNKNGLDYSRSYAKDLDLEVKIDVQPDQLRQLYKQADVYVHPSRFEGFCLPAVEAMSAGLPVVFQSGSAIDEIVTSKVGTSIPDSSGAISPNILQDWLNGIERCLTLKSNNTFGRDLTTHLLSLPTWKDSAIDLQKLYNELSTTL